MRAIAGPDEDKGIEDPMTTVQKALLTKELQKASAALRNAYQVAAQQQDRPSPMMKEIRLHQKSIGDTIVRLNGGPVISLAEVLS
jgi:hypothetical protein